MGSRGITTTLLAQLPKCCRPTSPTAASWIHTSMLQRKCHKLPQSFVKQTKVRRRCCCGWAKPVVQVVQPKGFRTYAVNSLVFFGAQIRWVPLLLQDTRYYCASRSLSWWRHYQEEGFVSH